MSTFAEQASKKRRPGKTLMLEPWVFADEWEERPDGTVCVGLRLIADGDYQKVRAAAEKLADELHSSPQTSSKKSNWIEAFNDALVRQVAALAVCDPNDVTLPSEHIPFAEDTVRFALTPAGARFIFDEVRAYEIASSIIEPMIEMGDVAELCIRIEDQFDAMSAAQKRLLAALLNELRDAEDAEIVG